MQFPGKRATMSQLEEFILRRLKRSRLSSREIQEGFAMKQEAKQLAPPEKGRSRAPLIIVIVLAVLIAAYKAFGGSPTPISWAETFTALQQGVVDGQCYGYIGFKAMKFNEANQKYLTEVHYTYELQPLVISERVFKKMTPEMQKLLIDAGKYAQEKSLLFQVEQAEASKRELVAGGLKVSQLEDEEQWKKVAIEKVWPEMADFVGGKDAINEYLKACGKQPWN